MRLKICVWGGLYCAGVGSAHDRLLIYECAACAVLFVCSGCHGIANMCFELDVQQFECVLALARELFIHVFRAEVMQG